MEDSVPPEGKSRDMEGGLISFLVFTRGDSYLPWGKNEELPVLNYIRVKSYPGEKQRDLFIYGTYIRR